MARVLASLIAASAIMLTAIAHDADALTVFAAASLKEALDEQARGFERDTGERVTISYAGSNALAKQIEAGAPADVFISADVDWMDYLDKRSLLAPGSRADLLSNRLVLIEPGSSRSKLTIAPGFSLAVALGTGKLAIANPDTVPAGRYGKAALISLGVWPSVQDQLARTENVRAALMLVARGEAPFGIVYATDALVEPKVHVVDSFPPNTHAPIVYPLAVIAASPAPARSRAFVAYLASDVARATWRRHGFTVIERGRS
jgi:molybdate transport system substrate-binding protein